MKISLFNINNSKVHELSVSKIKLDEFKHLEIVYLAMLQLILFSDDKHMQAITHLTAILTRRINKSVTGFMYVRLTSVWCFNETMKSRIL